MASIWRDNPELMVRLEKAQNHPLNWYRDITTFASFMDTKEELKAYVQGHEKLVAESDAANGEVK